MSRDIDSAAKFIGAGAATVGIAGSGILISQIILYFSVCKCVHKLLEIGVCACACELFPNFFLFYHNFIIYILK